MVENKYYEEDSLDSDEEEDLSSCTYSETDGDLTTEKKNANSTQTKQEKQPRLLKDAATAGASGAVGAGAAVVGTNAAVGAMGFTSSGIASGSLAASIMSFEAAASGGGVAAGGLTATLQSIGAVGLAGSSLVAVAVAGTGIGLAVAGGYIWSSRRQQRLEQQAMGFQKGKWVVILTPKHEKKVDVGDVPDTMCYSWDSLETAKAFYEQRRVTSRGILLLDPQCQEVAFEGTNDWRFQVKDEYCLAG